jgi:two-component system sensor histidine kinase AtoS
LGLANVAYVALLSSSMRAKNVDLSARHEDTQAYLRDLVAGMVNGVLAVDAERRVVMVNRAAEELLGTPGRELVGRESGQIAGLGGTELPAMLGGALASGVGIQARELELRTDGERATTVMCSVSVLRDAGGRASGAVAVLQDVTEQKEIEQRLSHLDRLALMGEFAAGMVHEINNPLTLVTVALDNAKHSARSGEQAEVVESLELAKRNLARLEKLSHRLLSFSRPVPLEVVPVDLGEALNEVLNIVAPQARTARVKVDREVPRGLGLLADESALEQVFLNLAANAVQAMPAGGTLTVSAGRVKARVGEVVAGRVGVGEGAGPAGIHAVRAFRPPVGSGGPGEEREFTWVQFTDTGVGMAPSAVERLGESFFTTKEQGTGLGIAIVCKILAQYRGVIEVWSKVGSGTTFRLWFPALTPAEMAEEAQSAGMAEAVWETASAVHEPNPLKGWTGFTADLPDAPGAPDKPRRRTKK